MKHPANKAARPAFTLVEMLIVISIIGLLAALLFPVFARVREGARATSCNSNLRQLGLAFTQYAQDYGGRYPFAARYQYWANGGHWVTGGLVGQPPHNFGDATAPQPAPYDGGGLANSSATDGTNYSYIKGREAKPAQGALFPYVKSEGVYVCPSAKNGSEKKLSYSMNCAIAAMSATRIRVPSEIVLLVDEGDTINDGYFWATVDKASDSTDSLFKGHNGGGNLLFCDGHVKFFNFANLPLDQNGSPTGQGTGQYLKTTTTGPVRFHDKAFGVKGSYSAPYLDPKKNACLDSLS